MRGRTLIRETSGSSICAFCAHRLDATRLPSRIQRRFLQSSRPVSKPPATASAIREEDDRSSVERFHAASSSASSWQPEPRGTFTISGGFGRRPAFGNVAASTPGRISGGLNGPSFGTGIIELTDEERAARSLVNEIAERQQQPQPRQPVNVFSNPDPASTRAGRPLPVSKSTTLAAAKKDRARELELARQREYREVAQSGNFRIRRTRLDFSVNSSDKTTKEQNTQDQPYNARAAGWNHLRRRIDHPANEPLSIPENRFSRDRAQREEAAKSGRYTPIGHRSINLSKSNESGELNSEPDNPSLSPSVRSVVPKTQDFLRRPKRSELLGKEPEPLINVKSGRALANEGEISQNRQTVDYVPTRIVPQYERDQPFKHEQSRGEGKKAWAENHVAEEPKRSTSLEDIPKGRDRDKARRRQQFVQEWDENEEQQALARAEVRRQRKRAKAAKKAAAPTPILLPEYISIANLAAALRTRIDDFVEKMEELGFEETAHDYILNGENAGLIAMEYNFEPIIDRGDSEDLKTRPGAEEISGLPPRSPVVTIMGHVDHGKTTLLDYLRKSSVAATEHGGITQHIGAFSVPMPSGKLVTFLDTPGHAAFLSMRQRGANVTDIVILVVAADDSVKPQTIEAINHAKAAKVPIIVAINKVDKEEANIERVKQDLARYGVEIEDFGGDTQVICVSGKTGQGVDKLEEAVVTLSEILDMRAEIDGQAEGWIIEASIKSMGKVATVLVRRGTMRSGDFIVAGKTWARIRCLRNEAGVQIAEAGPGTPVEIDGWKEQPLAGDEVLQAPTESKAKSVIEYRLEKEQREKMAEDMSAINEARRVEQDKREREKNDPLLDDVDVETTSPSGDTGKSNGPKQIFFIIKGDVSGSVEAVVESISSIGNGEVQPQILRSGVGQIAEFDIEHAAAAKGYLINFNTPVDPNISRMAQLAKVKILNHNIIYKLVDDIKATLSESLPPLITQRVLGEADVAQVFDITVKGREQKVIAGCKIRNGTVTKNARFRILRDGEKVFDGTLESLKNVKKDVTEMRKGSECGMGFEEWSDFQIGDQVQCYELKEEKRHL